MGFAASIYPVIQVAASISPVILLATTSHTLYCSQLEAGLGRQLGKICGSPWQGPACGGGAALSLLQEHIGQFHLLCFLTQMMQTYWWSLDYGNIGEDFKRGICRHFHTSFQEVGGKHVRKTWKIWWKEISQLQFCPCFSYRLMPGTFATGSGSSPFPVY